MGNMHMKTAQRYSSLGLSNQNCKEIHTLGLLNLRKKKIVTDVGKDVENLEPSCLTGGNALVVWQLWQTVW